MPHGLELPDWILWVVAAGAIATALLAVTALLVRTGRGMRSAGQWVAGIVRQEVTEIVDSKLVPVLKELYPNGGSSLRDQVDIVHQLITEHIAESIEDRRGLHEKLDELDRRTPGRQGD